MLVVVAVKDRRYRIEVGEGLEGTLPDLYCDSIAQKYFVPNFRKGEYGRGVFEGTAAIARKIAAENGVQVEGVPEAPVEPTVPVAYNANGGGIGVCCAPLIPMFIAAVLIGSFLSRRNRYHRSWGGGGYGGGGFWQGMMLGQPAQSDGRPFAWGIGPGAAAGLGAAAVLAVGEAGHLVAEVQAVAGEIHTCGKCGANNSGTAKFCASCGAPLQVGGGIGMTAGKAILIFLAVVVVIGLGLGGCAYSGYRQTITLDESVKSSWADVEVVLKRRFDLIPNVVETVKGYAKHEQQLLQGIADVRKSYFNATTTAEKAQAAGTLDGMLSRLLVLRETYPELKANENFRALQIELEGTENRIAEKRNRYKRRGQIAQLLHPGRSPARCTRAGRTCRRRSTSKRARGPRKRRR